MADNKKMLEKREQIKKKKPDFIRKDIHKKPKLKKNWKRPKGLQNKQRLRKKGHGKVPASGYRSPAQVRGMHKSGLIPVVVSTKKELELLSKDCGVIISGKVGDRKRKLLSEEAKKKSLQLLNLDAEKTISRIESMLKTRKEERKKKTDRKAEKKKAEEKEKAKKQEEKKAPETKEAVKDKPSNETEASEEAKKAQEKKELDKILTKKS